MWGIVRQAIENVKQTFLENPQSFFTEEDVRWRLLSEINSCLREAGKQYVQISDDLRTSRVHAEYPTPFKCSMADRGFMVKDADSDYRRGHIDLVVFDEKELSNFTFEDARAQHFRGVLPKFGALQIPLLSAAIELKLVRDIAHKNKTYSPNAQAEYAFQDLLKLSALTSKQEEYYPNVPWFAGKALLLIFDNSSLTGGHFREARENFDNRLKKLISEHGLTFNDRLLPHEIVRV
jgi:hypothetical protein